MKKNIKWQHKARIGKIAFSILMFIAVFMLLPFVGELIDGALSFVGIGGGIGGGILLGSIFMVDGKFKDISLSELEALTKEDQGAYKIAKMAYESAEKTRIDDAIKDFAEKYAKTEEKVKEMSDTLKEMSVLIRNSVNEKTSKDEIVTIKTQILKTFAIDKDNKKFNALSKINELGGFTVKATPTTTANAITDSTLAYRVEGIARTARPKFSFTEFFDVVDIQDKNSLKGLVYTDWDESSIVRAAAARAEGDAVATSELTMREYTLTLKNIADSFDITTDAMENVDIFARDLDNFLDDNMLRTINTKLYSGTGTGTEIMGIYTRVAAYVTTAFAGKKTSSPHIQDLALVVAKDILNGTDQDYQVDFVFVSWSQFLDLNPYDKDLNGNYIVKPTHGFIWIPSSFVTTNTMVIGDSSKVKIYRLKNGEFEIGYRAGGFEKRIKTTIVESVMNLLIREADLLAFRKITSISQSLIDITL